MEKKGQNRRKRFFAMALAAVMAFTAVPADVRADTAADKADMPMLVSAGDGTEQWVPISQYVQDTNYDVPTDYMQKKTGIDYGTVEDIQYQSTATNSTRKAKVILPAGYSTAKKYPVLYLLHGIFQNETTLFGEGVQNVIGNAIASGDSEEMIVVLPNACANETGSGEGFNLEHYAAYNNFINDFEDCLMPYINEHYSTATGRENTAISGFSMGGRVTLQIGFTLQDKVRYIGALNPAFGILEYENNGVHEDGLFTEETFTLQPQYMDDMLVLIAAGTNDSIVRDEPERYHNALAANQVPHIYYATKGINASGQEGSGDHNGDVYKHGLYNFMRRIFHKQSAPIAAEKPLFHFSLDNGQDGVESDGVKVTVNGTPQFTQDGVDGKAMFLDEDEQEYLALTKEDGSGLLAGRDALTISYWSKTENKTNWATYIAPDDSAPQFGKEKYLGIMDNDAKVTVERYLNTGSRPKSVSGSGRGGQWKHVAVVITETETRLYIDGKRAGSEVSTYKLSDIVGENGIFYIGKACRGAGEYFDGLIDDYSVYGYAMTDSQVNNLYSGKDLDDDSYIATEQMQRCYDSLSLGSVIPDGAVMKEGKLNLPAQLGSAAITWASDKENVIGKDGTVHLPASATEVTLTAKISLNGETTSKKFVVSALPASGQKEKFENDFLIPYVVTGETTLPTSYGQGSIAWSGTAVSSEGKVTATNQEQSVELTANWQMGNVSAAKTFAVKILAADAVALEAYTREPLAANVYSGKLAYSLHLAYQKEDGTYEGLYSNNGILYAKADISAQGTLTARNLKNPYVFAMADGGYGIICVRTDSSDEKMANAQDSLSRGKALLFTTKDFIHYDEVGLVDLKKNVFVSDIVCDYDSSAQKYVFRWSDTEGNYYRSSTADIRSLSAETEKGSVFGYDSQDTSIEGACERNRFYVPGSVGENLRRKFSTIYNTSVQVPGSVSVLKKEEVENVKAQLSYSDGSKASKKVDWNLAGVDFDKPGTYTVSGTVQRAPSMMSSNDTSLGVNRADPCVYYNPDDGYYYFIATNDANGNSTFSMKKAKTLEGLKDAQETEILNLDMYDDINTMVWAPEIHKIGGELYIFFSSNPGDPANWDVQSHVMHYKGGNLEDKDSWERPKRFLSKNGTPLNQAMADFGGITLDMTTFKIKDTRYVVWAQRDYGRRTGSVLCIGTIDETEPWKLTSDPVIISRPDYGWDNNDNTPVDEGPYAIIRDDKVFITFSGSSIGATYCVGLLSAELNRNLLDAQSWTKNNCPILYARGVEGETGPGHNSYTTDAAGNLVFVYHARPVDAAGNVGTRNTGLRTVHFDADGEPVLYMSGELELAKANEQVQMKVVVKDPNAQEPGTGGSGTEKPGTPSVNETFTGESGQTFKITSCSGGDNCVTLTGISANAADYTIPDTVTYKNQTFKVTAIEDNAFANQTNLKSVAIGKYVTSIGAKAFYNCKNLAKVTFKGTAVKTIGKDAFKGVKKNASFVMKKIFTFKNVKYKITKSTAAVKQVTVTGASNKNIASLNVPATVKYNGMTFKVTSVGKNAFKNKKKLKSVTIGKNVKSIGAGAFSGDARLAKVKFSGTAIKSIGKNAFKGIKKNAVFSVKKAKKAYYKKLLKKAKTKNYRVK